MMYHCVSLPTSLEKKYQDLRGFFNIVMRRFTQLTPNWTHYPTAGALVVDALSQPSGVVTEGMILAVPHVSEDYERQTHDYVLPTHFEVIHDMITQKRLDTVSKVKTELFTNGFAAPYNFASPGRLCFASH